LSCLVFGLGFEQAPHWKIAVVSGTGKKTGGFEPFIYKSHLFTKTGSGQKHRESTQKKSTVLSQLTPPSPSSARSAGWNALTARCLRIGSSGAAENGGVSCFPSVSLVFVPSLSWQNSIYLIFFLNSINGKPSTKERCLVQVHEPGRRGCG
jgi:hypothetical protein